MDSAELRLLGSELGSQLAEARRITALVEDRVGVPGPAGSESLAYQLHNLYCAYEDLCEMIARAFENHIDSRGGYHIELLRRMRIDVEGVRPRLLADESFRRLDALRSFRHVVRHAYARGLDDRRLRLVVDDAREALPLVERDLEVFLARLSGEVAETAPGVDAASER